MKKKIIIALAFAVLVSVGATVGNSKGVHAVSKVVDSCPGCPY
jgi:hypothetical protein